jgi:hypothetical protein
MKFLFYYFDSMSGMSINNHKSEVFLLGYDREEQERIANMFHSRLGGVSYGVSGMPIGEYRLNNDKFLPLVGKMTKNGSLAWEADVFFS